MILLSQVIIMTFLELAETVLKQQNQPLSTKEIWQIAEQEGLTKQLNSNGATPKATLGSALHVSANKNPGNPFLKADGRFYLKGMEVPPIEEPAVDPVEQNIKIFNERDLHPLLSYFVAHDHRFHCVTKTIFQEKSTRGTKGENEWLHPDLVGVHFPYGFYEDETVRLSSYFNANQYRLFSFEMKKDVNFGNLREYYFQAVSNSSWANQGYLVSLTFSEDPEFKDELARLNSAFGIGVIQLNPADLKNSQVLFPARENQIDWNTLNRLTNKNPDFKQFLNDVIGDIKAEKTHKEGYDKVLSKDALVQHMKETGILQ